MQRHDVQSRNMRSLGYDSQTATLEIEFELGNVYQYFNVPSETYKGLLGAISKGSYFHEHIKDHYAYRRVG